jgi:hypothetical protein
MTDIEKLKIEILRDALKDAIGTVQALDRKIVFLVSFNGVFLGLISTLFFKKEILTKIISNIELFYSILGVIDFIWIFVFIQIMLGISPKVNPIDVFKSEKDKKFSNNVFFIFTGANKNSLDLDDLIDSYSKIDTYKKIQKLLYKEIGKVSYIRDSKLKNIKISVNLTWMMIMLFTLFFMGFILYNQFK